MTSISLLFIRPLALYETTKPYTFHELPANVSEEERSNVENIKAGNIHVIDARTLADNELSYEDHRFRFVKHEASSTYSFSTEPDLLREYCKKIIGLVSEEFEAERVLCYDIRVRHAHKTSIEYAKSSDLTRSFSAPPVFSVHIDHTKSSGYNRIRRHLTIAEAERYLNTNYRARIVNVWRPLYRPVDASPLAFCDARTVSETDVIAVDQVASDYVFDLYELKQSLRQKWYWLSKHSPDEAAIFVQFDSNTVGNSNMLGACPHAAFHNPQEHEAALPRESVEVRLIVFSPLS